MHLSNYFVQDIQVDLAERLLSLTPFSKLFFTNSGTEAIEGLLKLAKKWGNEHNKKEIIAFSGSFHGRSLGALSITMQDKHQKHFLPLLPNVIEVPFDDTTAFEAAINENTLAVFYEGITGEGGVRPVSRFMLDAMKAGREKYGYLLIADEIQTGFGRTGKMFSFEHAGVEPDLITMAKGIAGGYPIAAVVGKTQIMDAPLPGGLGGTYGGSPVACAAALAVLEVMEKENLIERVRRLEPIIKNSLEPLLTHPHVADVRGKGFMWGIEFVKDKNTLAPFPRQAKVTERLFNALFERGVLVYKCVGVAGVEGDAIMIGPPFSIPENELKTGLQIIREVLESEDLRDMPSGM